MKVLMVGVDRTRKGGMWSVIENYLNDAEFCSQTNLTYIPTSTFGSIPHRIIFFAEAYLSIHRLLKKQKIDIVHIHMAEKGSTFRAGIIEKMVKSRHCKIVIQIHAEYKSWYIRKKNNIQSVIAQILRNADCLLIFGEYWKSFFSGITGSGTKIKILYNGISVPASNPYQKDALYLLYFAVIDSQKGIFDLLKALHRIDSSLPPHIKLAICGIDHNGEVQRAVKDLGLSHRVEMLGWIDNPQKEEIFARTCIHILPSYSEAFPMSILETMAHGIPNISTDISAIPEIIQNGKNGVLVHPGDIDALACTIRQLVLDSGKRMGFSQKAYETVCEKFSLQRQKNRLISFYEELLQENNK